MKAKKPRTWKPPVAPTHTSPSADVVARFSGYVAGARVLNNGDLALTVRVQENEKYQAMRLTDDTGLMLNFTVEAQEGIGDEITRVLEQLGLEDEAAS